MKSSATIPLAIIAAGVILAGAVYASMKGGASERAALESSMSAAALLRPRDHLLGSPTAKIKIIVYSDFDCTHCKDFNDTVRQVVSDFGPSGEVAWVFRNFPLTELYPHAKQHARAAECVANTAGNAAYFKFNELLFAHQPANPTKYAEYVLLAGASPEAVAACIQQAGTNGVDAKIDAERSEALSLGAQGAPFSLLVAEGEAPAVVDGALPHADLKDALDAARKSI